MAEDTPGPRVRDNTPGGSRKRHRVRADDPRYINEPIIVARGDGSIEVLRGDFEVTDEFRASSRARSLLAHDVDRPHLVLQNRRGTIRVRRIGALTDDDPDHDPRYIDRWDCPPAAGITGGHSFAEVRASCQAVLQLVDELEADGWELTWSPTEGMEPFLRDTRRPR